MTTANELDTAYKLFNLIEQLSELLWDRYHTYFLERHLDEEFLIGFDDPQQDISDSQSAESGKTHDRLK